MRAGLAMATIGALAGLVGAFALAQALSAFLYGVVPHDVAAFATATAVLMAAAVLASALPALRAVSTDAVTVLREE